MINVKPEGLRNVIQELFITLSTIAGPYAKRDGTHTPGEQTMRLRTTRDTTQNHGKAHTESGIPKDSTNQQKVRRHQQRREGKSARTFRKEEGEDCGKCIAHACIRGRSKAARVGLNQRNHHLKPTA